MELNRDNQSGEFLFPEDAAAPAVPTGDESAPQPTAVPAPIPAAPAPAVAPKAVIREDFPPPTEHFGEYLRMMRLRRELSLQELSSATKLSTSHLEALENEDYAALPQAVYVLAYIKLLCRYYGLPEEIMQVLTEDVRAQYLRECPATPDLDPAKVITDVENDDGTNQKRLRQILLIIGTGAALFLALVIVLIVLIVNRTSAPAQDPASAGGAPATLSESQLMKLQEAPVLEDSVLPVPTGK